MSAVDLFRKGFRIISDRQVWEQRQRKWWLMRHDGLRRRNKPFPQAADLHLKLVDEKINQKKAFTLASVFSQPRLCQFVSMKEQRNELSEAAADYFSFELKHRSNLLRVMQTAVDTMWLRGRGIIKAYVDPFDNYKIVHENVDPLYLLMPDDVNDFDDAYEWVHVRQMNVAKFKMDRRYCQNYQDGNGIDEGVLKKLCGGADAADRLRTQRGRDFDLIQLDKELREGFTHSNSSDTIIVWEHYVRTMGGITVYSYCPVAVDIEIRKPYGVPYKVGGRVSAPFFSFVAEVKDEGWYAPRGVAEKIADNEIYACKVWNAKADAITFLNTPQYTSEVGVQNPANYRLAPGEVLPPGVKPAIYSAPPVSFDQEINFARMESELSAQTPDMGITGHNQFGRSSKRTAKEVSVASGIAQIGQTNEGTIFRDDLSKLYAHDWGLMLQYKRKELSYFISDNLQTLPEDALHGEYVIHCGGATDDWDKNARLQKAAQRFEALKGAPNVNQDELVREFLSADDARLIKKLVIPQQQKQASEAADESTIINDICPGPNRPSFPIPVEPQQDHLTRAQVILQWMDAAGKMGTPSTLVEKQRLFERLQQHLMYLKKLQPEAFKQIVMQMKQMEQQQQPQGMPPQAPPQAPRRPAMKPAPEVGMKML